MRTLRLLLPAVLAATTLPALARVQPTSGFDLYSHDDELLVGKQAAEQTDKSLPLLPDDSPVTRYVQNLGARLAAHAPGQPWPYNFHVVNQKEINAFALPGGAIYVNLGTIQAADNEAELAGVMSHEIAHVVQRHGTRAATRQLAAQLPLALLGNLMGDGTAAKAAALGISFGVGSYFLKNSRQSESEADLLGTDIMYDAGYDPHALAEFFSKLQQQMGKSSNLQQFFSDHPNPDNRVAAVDREASTLPAKAYLPLSSDSFAAVKRSAAALKPMTAQEIAEWQKAHHIGEKEDKDETTDDRK